MFNRANSAESSTRVPYNRPTSPPPPLSEAVRRWLGKNNHHRNNNTFICPICFRAFNSTQALGGHQNAHRKVRSEERAHYIRQRLEHSRLLSASASTDSLADVAASLPPPRERHYCTRVEARSSGFEAGPSHKRSKIGGEEGENDLSLELTLAVGGSARAGGGPMAYTYPDVLFPASEFMETNLDLNLKL